MQWIVMELIAIWIVATPVVTLLIALGLHISADNREHDDG